MTNINKLEKHLHLFLQKLKYYVFSYVQKEVVKSILLIITLSIITLKSNGQNNFHVSYPVNLTSLGSSIATLSDTTYVIAVRYADTNNQDYKIGLIKINAQGDTLWTKRYADNYIISYAKVVSVSAGGFMLVGTSNPPNSGVLCIRTDNNGNPLWIRIHRTTGGAGTPSVSTTNDGGFAIAYSGYEETIIKLDSNGNYIWGSSRLISTFVSGAPIGYGPYTDIAKTIDAGFVTVGPSAGGSISGYNAFIIKYDSLGNLEWTRSLGGHSSDLFRSVISTNDGNIMAVGYTESFGAGSLDGLLVKLDLSGNILWSKTYGTSTGDHFFDIIQDPANGDYVVSGYKGPFLSSNLYPVIFRTDSIGNLLSSYQFNDRGYALASKITLDGGLLTTGLIIDPSQNNSSTFVRRSYSDGFSGCGVNPYPMIETVQTIMVDPNSVSGYHNPEEPIPTIFLDKLPIVVNHICITPPSSSTLNITACNIYTSPSGKYSWASNGTYLDTLIGANANGGDSIITINLTIIKNSTSVLNVLACDEYISHSTNHTWTSSGTYLDTLIGANALGCDSVITVNLTINNCDSPIVVPNIFTPNQDGQNDLFKPLISEKVKSIKIKIYNRWGQLIYETNQKNEGWDGHTTSGTTAPTGTYFYLIDVEIIKNGISIEKTYKGTLSLMH